jgi:hypothetical protein
MREGGFKVLALWGRRADTVEQVPEAVSWLQNLLPPKPSEVERIAASLGQLELTF